MTMITRYLILFLIPGLLLISSCGDFSSDSDRVTISISVNPPNAGSVLTSGGDEVGNTAEFLALPNNGWEFAGWTGTVESFDNPLSFTLESDVNLTANFSLFRNEYRYQLTLTDQVTSVDLQMGQLPGATDFFDSGIDLESPPSPPENILHAWFDSQEKELLWDFRNAFAPEIIWELEITGGQSETLTLSWTSLEESFTGTLFLTDADSSFEIDMTQTSQHSFSASQVETLQILYRFEQ